MIPALVDRLERDFYAIDHTDPRDVADPLDVAFRKGWNACREHNLRPIAAWRIGVALAELGKAWS